MPELPINLIDAGVAAVLLLSGLLAFSRGFVKESLAVAGWAGAAFITLYLYPLVDPFARKYIPITLLADGVTVVGIFIVSLVVLSIISHRISVRVRDSAIGPLDRSLGFIFGLARGAVVVIVAYMLMTRLIPPAEHPTIIREARVTPWTQRGADLLIHLAPETSQARAAVEGALEEARKFNDLTGGQLNEVIKKKVEELENKTGYGTPQRSQLDQLIKSKQDK
jgi:membrane protein required for colicin V production